MDEVGGGELGHVVADRDAAKPEVDHFLEEGLVGGSEVVGDDVKAGSSGWSGEVAVGTGDERGTVCCTGSEPS